MGARRGRRSDLAGRPPMRSPGRPPVARREHRERFWLAIASGSSSEDAGVAAGVSPAVGSRWFRQGGGMPSIRLAPLSGRYLSFAEREEIAILRDQGTEMAQHAQLRIDTGLVIYFCDPHSPWQRGSNENTVSVLRGPAGMLGQAGAGNDG